MILSRYNGEYNPELGVSKIELSLSRSSPPFFVIKPNTFYCRLHHNRYLSIFFPSLGRTLERRSIILKGTVNKNLSNKLKYLNTCGCKMGVIFENTYSTYLLAHFWVIMHYAPKISKCEVEARLCWNLIILPSLRFYVKSNFGKFQCPKMSILAILEVLDFDF